MGFQQIKNLRKILWGVFYKETGSQYYSAGRGTVEKLTLFLYEMKKKSKSEDSSLKERRGYMRLRNRIFAVLLTAAMTVTSVTLPGGTSRDVSAATTGSFENLNQSEITAAMGAGWNLGNQLEAANSGTPGETNWGNPFITEDLILAVKDAGFKSIRIPVSYLSMIGSAPNYTIDSSWLDRVQEVIDMCIDNDLYAIVNMHGDGYTTITGGWLLCGSSNQTEIKAKYQACWEQIADRFKDYDEHLIFESMNEEFDGTYGNPSSFAYENINDYNQIFVDTVRKSGGNNDKRWLLIPGWNTNINYTADNYGFRMPADNYLSDEVPSGEKRIMVSVHYYDPWDFCGTESGAVTQWGDTATDGSKTASWGDESYMRSQFKKMYDVFVAEGYPVVIGEYGSIDKSDFDSSNTANRAEFARKVCYYSDMYGLIPVYWDNGYNGQYGFGLFDRYSYKVTQQTIIDAIMEIYGGSQEATATGIKLDKSELTIAIGDEKVSLVASLTPSTSTDKIKWTSSDEDVATVNSKGQVSAVGTGTCTITATTPKGYSASCKVTVPKPSSIRAKLFLLETSSWQSVVSDTFADITSSGGTYSISLDATKDQLSNIGSLYLKDISVGDGEASAFESAKLTVHSITVNGQEYSMKNDTFTYDADAEASDDGLLNNVFDFSFINVWANTHVNNVTVENANYKAYFNNISYTNSNTVTVNFSISEINNGTGSVTAAPTEEPTVEPTQEPTVAPTEEPTAAPTQEPTVAPTEEPTAAPTQEPTVEPTTAPTEEPTESAEPSEEKILFEGDTNQSYETADVSWLMDAADTDIVTLVYTCTDSAHAYWGILGWGASVNGAWMNGNYYSASASPSDIITESCTVAEMKESLGIGKGDNVSYLCLSAYNGGKIVSLSISGKIDPVEPTTEPTVEPTAAPTVEPTTEPTVEPTAAPTVEPTIEPTTAPTVEPTAEPTETPSTGDTVKATYKMNADWGAGGLADITIENTTGKTFTDGWTVEFTFDRAIKTSWSCNVENLGNNRYRLTNPSWNSYLAAGEAITLSFELGSGSSSPVLSDVSLY